MICPYCNAEMKKGVLSAGNPIVWFDGEEKDYSSFIGFKNGETYAEHHWHKISHGFLKGCFVKSYRCENCKVIISKE